MTSLAASYAPLVPSPLNPSNSRDGGYIAKRVARRGRSRSRRSHTLTQKLLRNKAAEAWRGYILSSQLVQYESTQVHSRVHKNRSRCCCTPLTRLSKLGLGFSFVGYSESQQRTVLFRFPDWSSWSTQRAMLAMGLAGVIPALGVRKLLQSTGESL